VLSLTLSACDSAEAVIVYASFSHRVRRFGSSAMSCCANGQVVPDASKGRCVFILRLKESKNNSV